MTALELTVVSERICSLYIEGVRLHNVKANAAESDKMENKRKKFICAVFIKCLSKKANLGIL